jgi:hypothetical protein
MPRCHDNYHSFEAAWMLKNLIMKKIWSPINPTISSFPLAIYILLPLFSIGIIGSELLFFISYILCSYVNYRVFVRCCVMVSGVCFEILAPKRTETIYLC